MNPESIEKYLSLAMDWAIAFVPKAIIAGLILYIGMKLVKKIDKIFEGIFNKAKVEPAISGFLISIISIILKIVVFMFAASILGFHMSSLLGVLAAAGFAIGLALQGFLGNFASGLTIIFFKPYKVGDWIQVSDTFGRVQRIEIFNTILVTPNDRTLIIPNGQVTDNIITNMSTEGKIRIELQVTMPYEESFPKVKSVIEGALKDVNSILHDPAPIIGIEAYDSHNIVVGIRPYILPDAYWSATYEVYGAIKKAFNDNNIKAAYSEGVELGSIGE